MTTPARPFDDIRNLFTAMPQPSSAAREAVRARNRQLARPAGALGRLEEIVEWLAAVQGKPMPAIDHPFVVIFAANHGVAGKGVSAYPASATKNMVANISAGGAAINQICATYGLGLKVFELALEVPTTDISEGAALEEAACAATFAFGMEAIAGGTDLLVLGEAGVGTTTVAAAIYHALYGGAAADWVGRGSGLDDAGLARKIAVVEQAVRLHKDHLADPLEVLRRLGGREIAALAGAIMAARIERVPVILDGYGGTAAAAVLHALDPRALDHCFAGHRSAEGAHAEVLARLGKVPLIDLGLRLGGGTGGALAAGLVMAALASHRDMKTLAEADAVQKQGEET